MKRDSQLALFTDLYELTMLQAYYDEEMNGLAVFDLFVRELPERRNFLVACGLESALDYLETLAFSSEDLSHLASLGMFSDSFLDYLARFRFTGRVRAAPEGTIIFPPEPFLEIEAPLPEAQFAETFLLNQMTFETMIASKGVRAVIAAQGRSLADFGSRRAHGVDAALKAARSLYLAGFSATSNVLAGQRFGIPVVGTIAHSYIEAHDNEMDAFRTFVRTYPKSVLLVDTYDTGAGVRHVLRLADEMGDAFEVSGVRLDSGHLDELAIECRRILDQVGLERVKIVASGRLDEYSVDRLVSAGVPIASFGVGTSVVVSSDAPALDSAYKLVAYQERPRMKLSSGKSTLPGRKQVYRRMDQGRIAGDVIALNDEHLVGEPLLQDVMVDGRRLPSACLALQEARDRLREEIARLPERLLALAPVTPKYPVTVSMRLQEEKCRLQEDLMRKESCV